MDELDIDKLKNVSIDLSSLKRKVDKLHIGKLETTPVDLNKVNNVIKNDLVEKLNMVNWLKKLMLFKILILVD